MDYQNFLAFLLLGALLPVLLFLHHTSTHNVSLNTLSLLFVGAGPKGCPGRPMEDVQHGVNACLKHASLSPLAG